MYQAVLAAVFIIAIIVTFSWKRRAITSDQKLQYLKDKISVLDPRTKEFNFSVDDNGSYILGSRDIFMCIRDEHGDYYDDNFLIYVAMHELVHGLIPQNTEHHPPIFDKTFNEMKELAIRMKIYDPTIPFPRTYCGKPLNEYYA